jgi:hypothetical protein
MVITHYRSQNSTPGLWLPCRPTHGPISFPVIKKVECHHSKPYTARCFNKDLHSLLLGLYSTNSDSVRFQNGRGPLKQTCSRLRYASSAVNTSRHSVPYVFPRNNEIERRNGHWRLSMCLLQNRSHLSRQLNRNNKHAIQWRSSYIQGPPKKCIHNLTKENSTLYNYCIYALHCIYALQNQG